MMKNRDYFFWMLGLLIFPGGISVRKQCVIYFLDSPSLNRQLEEYENVVAYASSYLKNLFEIIYYFKNEKCHCEFRAKHKDHFFVVEKISRKIRNYDFYFYNFL